MISKLVDLKVVLLSLLSVLILFGGFLCCDNRENRVLKDRVRELELRLAESRQKADTFYIHDSIPVWREKIVEVDKTDYKKVFADRELIKELQLKLSQVESEHQMLLSTGDSVVLNEVNDSLLTYSDKWIDFSYELRSRVLDWEVRDSLTILVTKVYKHKFLWFRWGKKGEEVYIVNHNPHSKVKYNRYIKVK